MQKRVIRTELVHSKNKCACMIGGCLGAWLLRYGRPRSKKNINSVNREAGKIIKMTLTLISDGYVETKHT